jgi:hypothetical protein
MADDANDTTATTEPERPALVAALVEKIKEFRSTAKPQGLIADELTAIVDEHLTDDEREALASLKSA